MDGHYYLLLFYFDMLIILHVNVFKNTNQNQITLWPCTTIPTFYIPLKLHWENIVLNAFEPVFLYVSSAECETFLLFLILTDAR